MVIKSLNLNLKDNNTKKFIIIILIALIIAISLIFITAVNMINESYEIKENSNFFELYSYSLKASVKVISNKNANMYDIEEFYLKNQENQEKFKFVTKNTDNVSVTYIISNDCIYVKNEEQKSEYHLSNYLVKKSNLLSISTFIELYNGIVNAKNLNNLCFKVEDIKYDNLTRYKITYLQQGDEECKCGCEICSKFKYVLRNGINVNKLELVYDNKLRIPLEYIVYSNNEAIIDINFTEFSINSQIDEKIFAF